MTLLALLPPHVAIGFGTGKITPPPMHHERCLSEPITIHRRRRNCTDRQCPFRASLCELDSQVFLVTRPMTAVVSGRLGGSRHLLGFATHREANTPSEASAETPLPPRGKSIAPNRGLTLSERQYNSKSPCIRQGRDFEILDEPGRLSAPKNYFTTSQWPVLSEPTRRISSASTSERIETLTVSRVTPTASARRS